MKRFTILALVVSAAALCLSVIGFITVSRQVQEMQALAKRTEQAAEQTQAQLAEAQESQSAAIAAVQLTTENQGKELDGLAEQVRKLSEQPAKDIQYLRRTKPRRRRTRSCPVIFQGLPSRKPGAAGRMTTAPSATNIPWSSC